MPGFEHNDAGVFLFALDQTRDRVTITDLDGSILYVNKGFEYVTGYSASEVILKKPSILKSGYHDDAFYRKLWSTIRSGNTFRADVINRRKNGEPYFERQTISPFLDSEGKIKYFVSVGRDITRERRMMQQLHHHAESDRVTEVYPRKALFEKLDECLEQATPGQDCIACLLVDVDDFHLINESLGNVVGDDILREVAHRLRQVSHTKSLIGRLYADQFVVVVTNVNQLEARVMASQIKAKIESSPFFVEHIERAVQIKVSLGISFFRQDADSAETLVLKAKTAMRKAKGRSGIEFADRDTADALDRLRLLTDLHDAILRDELSLHFQPIFSLTHNRPIGLEALVRWNHDRLGMVPPSIFVPLAEQTGYVIDLDSWVWSKVPEYVASLPGECSRLDIAVNVSPQSFYSGVLSTALDRIESLVAERLIVEVTETAFAEPEIALKTLEYVKNLGVKVAVDDFGTGYSSLSYLQKFPLDILKIDRSFIDGIERGKKNEAISEAVIALSQSLGLTSLAEGVETEFQLKWLQNHGCKLAQGFLLGRPAPMDELLDSIRC